MKNKKRILLGLLIFILVIISINSILLQSNDFSNIIGKEWKVLFISGKQLNSADLENGLPRITFHKDNKLSGFTGCNTFNGNYQIDNYQISLDQGVMTKMMCNGTTEMKLLSAFDEINRWKISEDKLILLCKEKVVLVLVLAGK